MNRFKSEKKVFMSNLSSIDGLKRDIAGQLAEKNELIEQLSSSLRKVERTHGECRVKMEEYERVVNEGEVERMELK